MPSGYPLVCPCLVLPRTSESAAVVGDDVENFLHVGAASTAVGPREISPCRCRHLGEIIATFR